MDSFLISTWGGILHFLFLLDGVLSFLHVVGIALSSRSITSLPYSWTHMVMSLLIDHLSLYVLYYMLKGMYYCGRVFIIYCTKKDSDISTSRFFIWATMSLICMMCSRTSLILVSFMDENFMIGMLASALSEMMN